MFFASKSMDEVKMEYRACWEKIDHLWNKALIGDMSEFYFPLEKKFLYQMDKIVSKGAKVSKKKKDKKMAEIGYSLAILCEDLILFFLEHHSDVSKDFEYFISKDNGYIKNLHENTKKAIDGENSTKFSSRFYA